MEKENQTAERITLAELPPVCVGVEDACLLLGVSRSIFYKLIHRADFPAFKVGGRMLVNVDGLRRWVDAQTEQAQTEREGVKP